MARLSLLVVSCLLAALLSCGGSVATVDDVGQPEGAIADLGSHVVGHAPATAGDVAPSCWAEGAPCFFVDGGGGCCEGLACNATSGTAVCAPLVAVCITAGDACSPDAAAGPPCCPGLRCDSVSATHYEPECIP